MTRRVLMPAAVRAAAERLRMSPGVVSGHLIFLTGVTGSDAQGRMPADLDTQFRNVFGKIATVLAEGGLDFGAIVEMTSYHVGLRDHFDQFDAARLAHLREPWPAWTAVEVAQLRREGAVVEVRVVASLDPDR